MKEGFAELRAPLLRDVPFARVLELNAAVRLSDYSTVGGTTTWQVNSVYAPIEDIRIRGGYSNAVRAPNVTELFAPTNGAFSFISDPCDPQFLPEGSATRTANCVAQLNAAGLTPAQIAAFNPQSDPSATASLPGRSGGNPNLTEETAKTWTVGVVLQPRFLPGLQIIADWYSIELENAISRPTAQTLAELCVDQPTLDNVYCQNIERSVTTGYISGYLVAPQNVAAFRTRGVDVTANYRIDAAAAGTFNLRLVGNYLNRLDFVPTPGADREDELRSAAYPAPEYSGTFDLTWIKGPVTLNYGLSYFSALRRFTPDQLRANPDLSDPELFSYREKWEHDIQASFAIDGGHSVYLGVNNLIARQGDVGSISTPYSFIGRYFYAGARVRFPGI